MILSKEAARELEAIRNRELREVDPVEDIRQIFSNNDWVTRAPRLTNSGLVEQQAWFMKLRERTQNL